LRIAIELHGLFAGISRRPSCLWFW
jgi:hypothetical protein